MTLSNNKNFPNLVGVDSDWDPESPGQAEVGDLDRALTVDEQVLRLQVAVKNSALKHQNEGFYYF